MLRSAQPRSELHSEADHRAGTGQTSPNGHAAEHDPGMRGHRLLARGADEHRAISVQLTRVRRGQSGLLGVSRVGCSAAVSAVICPIPKLTVPTFPCPLRAR